MYSEINTARMTNAFVGKLGRGHLKDLDINGKIINMDLQEGE